MVRSAVLALAVASTGCRALLGIEDFHTAETDAGTDAMIDAAIDAPSDSLTCYGTLKPICFTSVPTGNLSISGTLNTTSDNRCVNYPQTGGLDLCVIAADIVTVSANTVVTGNRPLVLVGASGVRVMAFLDASSHRGMAPGSAANAAGCPVLTGTTQNQGGGGGGGAGFGIAGGVGGGGSGGANGGAAGPATSAVALIRGGCPGGKGGDGDPMSAGTGGDGGGALVLLAGSMIQVMNAGGVFASGAGGGGASRTGPNRGAGGGGGSGGLVVLEAPMIDLQGTVTSNGGGGGGGADLGAGSDGEDGRQGAYNQVANGGANEGASHGGPGGDGAFLSSTADAGLAAPNGGGGGGGGAVGVIWVKGTVTGGTKVSPALQTH